MHTRLSPRAYGRSPGQRRRWPLVVGGVIVVGSLSLFGMAASAAPAVKAAPTATTSVAPNPANEVDCNGATKAYKTIRKMAATCVDPIRVANGKGKRIALRPALLPAEQLHP